MINVYISGREMQQPRRARMTLETSNGRMLCFQLQPDDRGYDSRAIEDMRPSTDDRIRYEEARLARDRLLERRPRPPRDRSTERRRRRSRSRERRRSRSRSRERRRSRTRSPLRNDFRQALTSRDGAHRRGADRCTTCHCRRDLHAKTGIDDTCKTFLKKKEQRKGRPTCDWKFCNARFDHLLAACETIRQTCPECGMLGHRRYQRSACGNFYDYIYYISLLKINQRQAYSEDFKSLVTEAEKAAERQNIIL